MKFKLTDFLSECLGYVSNAPQHSEENYQIVISAKCDCDLTSDTKAIIQKLARMRKEKYKNLLWYVGLSNHDSRGNIHKVTQHTGKVGRPKIVVRGKKTNTHMHIFLMSCCKSDNIQPEADELITFIKRRNKKYNSLKQHKSSKVFGCGYISYVNRQSGHIFKTSGYDFDYFINPMYDDSLNCNNFE